MSAIPAAPLQHMKFDNSLGAMLIGALVSTALFGLTSLQTYLYFINYPKDKAAIKCLVGTILVFDFAHSVILSHSTYHFMVQQYGNPASLMQSEWSIIAQVGVTVPVALLVQGFMAHRVYKLSNNNWLLTGIIAILSLGHAGLGLASTVRMAQLRLFTKLPEIMGLMSATLVVMAANDLFTTAALCWLLHRAQSNFAETQSMIRTCIVYTIETGLLTSVVATIDAICILTMPRNWIFIAVTFCISKLYANSLLTILNSRRSLQNKMVLSHKMSSSNNRNSHVLTSLRLQRASERKDIELQIKTETTTETQFDAPPHGTNQTGLAV